jgi:hypothetical protein
MNQLRRAYAGAFLSSGLASAASEKGVAAGLAGQGDPFFQATSFPLNETRSEKTSLL